MENLVTVEFFGELDIYLPSANKSYREQRENQSVYFRTNMIHLHENNGRPRDINEKSGKRERPCKGILTEQRCPDDLLKSKEHRSYLEGNTRIGLMAFGQKKINDNQNRQRDRRQA